MFWPGPLHWSHPAASHGIGDKPDANWLGGHLSNIIFCAFSSPWLASFLCSPIYSPFSSTTLEVVFPQLPWQSPAPSRSTILYMFILYKTAYPFAHNCGPTGKKYFQNTLEIFMRQQGFGFPWWLGNRSWNCDQSRVLTDIFNWHREIAVIDCL